MTLVLIKVEGLDIYVVLIAEEEFWLMTGVCKEVLWTLSLVKVKLMLLILEFGWMVEVVEVEVDEKLVLVLDEFHSFDLICSGLLL